MKTPQSWNNYDYCGTGLCEQAEAIQQIVDDQQTGILLIEV